MKNKVAPAVLLPLVLVLLALAGCGARKVTADNAVDVISVLEPSKEPHALRVTGAVDGDALDEIVAAVRSVGKRGVCVSLDLSDTTRLMEIGEKTFEDCTALTGITLPASVTKIERMAFDGCTGLTSVTIHDGVTEIESYAFEDCTGLTSVSIPASVTYIGSGAFGGCTGLRGVTFEDKDSTWNAGGTEIDVANPARNAIRLTGSFFGNYWRKQP